MLDVRSFHLDVPGLEAYLHPMDGRRPETLAGQKRLLAKWNANRNALHARTRMDPEEILTYQLERISFLVDIAFASHPFYHELYNGVGFRSGDIVHWPDYHALPTITKNDIIDHWPQFISRALPPDECYSSRTSGSSGRTLTILQDDATSDQGLLFYLRHYEQLLNRKRHTDEWLYEVYLAPPRYTSLDSAYPVFTLSQDCPPYIAFEHLRSFRPTLLSAFPSYLNRLLALPVDLSEIGIAALCTNSESSTVGERKAIGERFGAPVFDEYSSEELYLIATECRHGSYHVVEDNVRVDVLPGPDGLGEIVATSLWNTYMPFIRYRQGDVVEMDEGQSQCQCGSTFRRLTKFHGRTDQLLRAKDGAIVAPDRVMGLYDRTLIPSEAGVAEFRLVQTSIDSLDLLIVPDVTSIPPESACVELFVSGLRQLFQDPSLQVAIHFVDTIPPELSHKRRLISCNL